MNNKAIIEFSRNHSSYNLFCFHYAGAGASVFNKWGDYFKSQINVLAIQLPGRENRFNETLIDSVEAIVKHLFDKIIGFISNKPYYFFGHSFGGLISFELANLIQVRKLPMPKSLFISGCRAPHYKHYTKQIHNLEEDDVIAALAEYGGTSTFLLENKELMKLYLPQICADFKACATYQYVDKPPLLCPIRVFGGKEDPDITNQHLQGWSKYTISDFQVHLFKGGHFFLHSEIKQVIEKITNLLNQDTDS